MVIRNTKEIQNILLEDYKIISEIWKKHNYFFCFTGGSLLGAVRHKGFIPWDDDLDPGLARDDYEDFIKNTYKELPDYLCLHLRTKTQQYLIFDNRFEIELDSENLDSITDDTSIVAHPYIDLQIFDGTPNNKIQRMLFCLKVMAQRAKIKIADPSKIHTQKWRPWWENLIIRMSKLFPYNKNIDVDLETKKYNKLIQKYSFKDSLYIADFVGKYHLKDIYPKKWWDPVSWVPFEDTIVPIPNGYHQYLTKIYGDYMVIPKKEDQVQHTTEKKD